MSLDVLFFFIIVILLAVISYLVFFRGDDREKNVFEDSPALPDNTQELPEINLSKIHADIERKNASERQKPSSKPIANGDIPTGYFQFTPDMRVRFTHVETGGYTEVIPKIDKSMLIGRSHETLSNQPDVDLTPFLMEEHGVSRRHALLRLRDLRLEIQDLDSKNGTRINGYRFQPKTSHQIRDNDIVTLGRVNLRISFLRKDGSAIKS